MNFLQLTLKRFFDKWSQIKIEHRIGLPTVLHILICLHDDGSECQRRSDILCRANGSMGHRKSIPQQPPERQLDTGRRPGHVIVGIMNVDDVFSKRLFRFR